MQDSKIEWTDRTWNPVTGCTKVSQGCKHCYAERIYERFHGKGSFKNVISHDERLQQPLKWKKPSMIFVNSMSDLFHEDVPWNFIYKVFEIMHLARWHTFQVLTKRSERLHELNDIYFHLKRNYPDATFPSKNVWIGVSVEDQKAADERIKHLISCQAAVIFLSCEPLLGPLDLTDIGLDGCGCNVLSGIADPIPIPFNKIDWVILGGESGPGARPMHPDWAKSVRNQCETYGVPFFFKQWGEYYTHSFLLNESRDPVFRMFRDKQHWINKATTWVRGGRCISVDGRECKIGRDFDECSYPVAIMDKIGKKKAGRLLDGREHNEFPISAV